MTQKVKKVLVVKAKLQTRLAAGNRWPSEVASDFGVGRAHNSPSPQTEQIDFTEQAQNALMIGFTSRRCSSLVIGR
jgi:hypothetical protein